MYFVSPWRLGWLTILLRGLPFLLVKRILDEFMHSQTLKKHPFFHKNCLRLEIFSHIEKSRDESLHPWTTNTKSGCLCFIRISKFKKQNRQLLWKMRRACIGHIWCYKNGAQAEHAWCHKDEIISGTYTGKRQNGVRGFSLCLWQWVLMHVDQNESNYFLFSILIATYLL